MRVRVTMCRVTYLVLMMMVGRVTAVCTPAFSQQSYSGAIVFTEDGAPELEGEQGSGIELIVGCEEGVDEEVEVTVSDQFYQQQFTVEQAILRRPSHVRIVVAETFNINTNTPLIFSIQACDPTSLTTCTTAQVSLSYPYNQHPPVFNQQSITTTLDVTSCSPSCPLLLPIPLAASDQDSDPVTFSILRSSLHSELFGLEDETRPNIEYIGGNLAANTPVTLILMARDSGHLDTKTAMVTINVELVTQEEDPSVTNPPTDPTTPEPQECDEAKEKLYFLIMIILASVLGGLLILLLLVPLCICCCRRGSGSLAVGGGGTVKPSVKNAGVLPAGASYKSYSEMNYVTLQEVPPSSNSSSPDSLPRDERKVDSSTGRVRSRPKSNRALPQGYTTEGRDSNI